MHTLFHGLGFSNVRLGLQSTQSNITFSHQHILQRLLIPLAIPSSGLHTQIRTSSMTSTRIVELAAQIQENTTRVDDYLRRKHLASPSFDVDGPVDFQIEDGEIQRAREKALDSSLELHQLLLGPAMCLRPVVNVQTLQAPRSPVDTVFTAVEWCKPTSNLQIRHPLPRSHPR